jgi:hypothetical protein
MRSLEVWLLSSSGRVGITAYYLHNGITYY